MAEKIPVADLAARIEQLLERDARREAEMQSLRLTLDALAGRPREPETLIPESYKAWAALSAEEKTQLAADKRWPPAQGTRPFEVQLVYVKPVKMLSDDGPERPRDSEWPRVRLQAHNDAEARALYLELCGITGFSHDVSRLEAVALAA
jgi:hypothetical protein